MIQIRIQVLVALDSENAEKLAGLLRGSGLVAATALPDSLRNGHH